jgi:RNA polymerase sigma factor (sigma-70 family)
VTPTTIAIGSYEQHRAYVLSVLARRCRWIGAEDREAILHDAYAVLLEKERAGTLDVAAMRPEQVRAYLTQTAINKALTERDRAHTRRSVAFDGDDGIGEPPDDAPSVEEILGAAADSARLREIVAELPERQQVVVALRYFHDRTPADVRSYLGITDRAYRRELERAMRTLSARMEEVRDGSFCDSRRSLILAYVAGIAGPNRMRDARRHLESCPGCTAWARELREAAQQAGAFVPLPLLAAAAGGDDGHHLFALGRGLRDLFGGARDHATGLATRADPATGSLLGAVRPGAVAVVLAGCIGVGSTATYCAFQGLPAPLGGTHHATTTPKREAAQPAPRRIAPAVTTSAAATPTTTTSTTNKTNATTSTAKAKSKATKAAAAKARRRAAARRVARATAPEFGVEGTGTATPAAATATPRTSSGSPSGSTSQSNGGWGQEFGP